jgi:hypothetical protein
MISQQKLKRKLNERAGLATRTRQRKDKENEHERLLAALVKDGLLLQHAPEKCRSDKKFVIAAVSQNGLALNFASAELKGEVDVVLAAVRNNWRAIRMTSKDLSNNREIFLAAVVRNSKLILNASLILRADKEIVLAAMGHRRQFQTSEVADLALDIYNGASPELKSDIDVVKNIVTQHFQGLLYSLLTFLRPIKKWSSLP